MSGFVKTEPCAACSDLKLLDPESGFWGCARSYAGDLECADYLEARLIDDEIAPQAAALIRRVHDEAKRRELAIAWADGLADLLYPQAEFDTEAFLAACGLHPLAVAR